MKKSDISPCPSHCFSMVSNLLDSAMFKSKAIFKSIIFKSTSVFSAATLLLLLQVGCATPVGKVESWPVTNAEKSQFSGEVVDVLCELGGNCANECGQGTRQLAIKTQDKSLGQNSGVVLVAKNLNNYSGAADELWQLCGQQVELNGLFTEHRGVRFFQVQNIREAGGQWQKATKYLDAWVERSGKSPQQAKNWQEHDERVSGVLERDGRLGLGTKADQDYFK